MQANLFNSISFATVIFSGQVDDLRGSNQEKHTPFVWYLQIDTLLTFGYYKQENKSFQELQWKPPVSIWQIVKGRIERLTETETHLDSTIQLYIKSLIKTWTYYLLYQYNFCDLNRFETSSILNNKKHNKLMLFINLINLWIINIILICTYRTLSAKSSDFKLNAQLLSSPHLVNCCYSKIIIINATDAIINKMMTILIGSLIHQMNFFRKKCIILLQSGCQIGI